MFLDVHINNHLIRRRTFAGIYVRLAKETKAADTLGRLADLAWIERVALDHLELATYDTIQRSGIALDINPLNKDARAAGNGELDIQRQVAVIAGDAGFHTNKVQTLLNRQPFHPCNGRFNRNWRICPTAFDFRGPHEFFGIHFGKVANRSDLAKLEGLSFAQTERQEKPVAFTGDFRVDRQNAKIDIAARQIEIPQHLFIKFNPISDKRILLDHRPQQARLLGFQNATQTPVRIGAVTNKAKTLDFDDFAFDHFEHQINAVIRAADDLWRNGCRITPGLAVSLGDDGGVGFGCGRAVNVARA